MRPLDSSSLRSISPDPLSHHKGMACLVLADHACAPVLLATRLPSSPLHRAREGEPKQVLTENTIVSLSRNTTLRLC